MIRYYNALILMPDQSLLNGELVTDGSVISYIGKEKKEGLTFEREINLNGNLIIPAFKNAHTHSAMTFLRSYADDLPLSEWLFNKVFPLEAKLTADDIYLFTKIAVLEYLTSGISTSFDMYFEPEAYVQANTEYGFRTVLCGAVSGEAKNAEKLEKRYNKFNGISPLISYKLGFHAEYTASEELLDAVGALAKKYKAPVFMHNSETESETENCIKKYGKTPTALFESKGIFDYGGGGFHCVYLIDNDMDIFVKRGLFEVTCPASNAKLASGIAPLTRMMKKGVKIAMGTDGPASNNCLDMFREMFLATALQKIAQKDASALDGAEVL
ncbi:MAG: amidohydrolase family protein, partial [Clostridia bacterium]|nr:amidohydrolase family protein [Clostridia bacterium]